MEVVEFNGWSCARLVSGDVEAFITLDVGPRVVRLGFIGGPNEFCEFEAEKGLTGGEEFRSYGGHRLWVAPEDFDVTYFAENSPVQVVEEGDWIAFFTATDKHGLQRELRIKSTGGGCFELEHRIHNRGIAPFTLAPWALTVMAPGGECLFPQEPFASHSDNFLPVRPLVLWAYTDMTDPRWTWGKKLIRLRHDPKGRPQKVGAFVSAGWAAYKNGDRLFVKRFPALANGTYLDFGCNFETFTREDMLEVESVGLKEDVQPKDYASLREGWSLSRPPHWPSDESAVVDLLQSVADSCPHP